MSAPLPPALEVEIEDAIETYPDGRLADLVEQSRFDEASLPLIVKYTAAKWSAPYKRRTGRIHISDSIDFTWGTGAYVTPLACPYSSAIFGRVGVVASFDPAGWRVFDATETRNQDLYLQWLRRQPLFRMSVLTMHSALSNHFLRNDFRERFEIDCVLFEPDQSNPVYTRRGDVWMAVADFSGPSGGRRIKTGASARFEDAKLTVLVEEEFEDRLHGVVRGGLLELSSGLPDPAQATAKIAEAHATDKIVRVRA